MEFRDLMIGPEFYAPHQRRRFRKFLANGFFASGRPGNERPSLASMATSKNTGQRKKSSGFRTKKFLLNGLIGADADGMTKLLARRHFMFARGLVRSLWKKIESANARTKQDAGNGKLGCSATWKTS